MPINMTNLKNGGLSITLIAALGTAAVAGGIDEPIMEPQIIIEETAKPSSSGASIMPRIIFMLFTLVARVA